jgi:hypothetical protein
MQVKTLNFIKVYCKNSAPKKPTKQAPSSNKKNVIGITFLSTIYIGRSQYAG